MAQERDGAQQFPESRADDLQNLLNAIQPLVVGHVQEAEEPQSSLASSNTLSLVEPLELAKHFSEAFPDAGLGVEGTLNLAHDVLGASVNTWRQGFMSHLYASNNPVGVISDLILSILNTNVHVYQTSPALSVIEKKVTKALALLFGLEGPFAGGVSQQGGSASNLTALVAARNSMFPETKSEGVYRSNGKLVLFTSSAGHYSLEKAAQVCGLGSHAVWTVPLDAEGALSTSRLIELIREARSQNCQPFFVNATAGTTVLGTFDPLEDIAQVCQDENLWFHIDASWGGGVVFSSQQKHKMKGAGLADSISFCPHKMLNVPITCSFLLVSDLRKLWRANTLPAGYLFHQPNGDANMNGIEHEPDNYKESWDIADMTLQCGRRGDALKMALGWIYYGTNGYGSRIDKAFAIASDLANMIAQHPMLTLVSQSPPPCLSVCFYYGILGDKTRVARRTHAIVERLRHFGYWIEHAPGEQGPFLRIVINLETWPNTIEKILELVVQIGATLEDTPFPKN